MGGTGVGEVAVVGVRGESQQTGRVGGSVPDGVDHLGEGDGKRRVARELGGGGECGHLHVTNVVDVERLLQTNHQSLQVTTRRNHQKCSLK